MSTATAEPKTKVTFIARSPNQVLTRRKTRHVDDGFGGKKVLNYEDWLESERELNRVREARGQEVQPIDETPWKVEFTNSTFSTEDPGLVEWMRSHPRFNVPGPSGFYEMGKAPDEPQPTTDEQMTEIAEGAALGDLGRVEAALQIEKETHNRQPILLAAEAAAKRLRELASSLGADADSETGDPSSTASS